MTAAPPSPLPRPSPDATQAHTWQPLILDPMNPEQADQLHALVANGRVWQVHDTLAEQMRNLVATRAPHRCMTQHELNTAVRALLRGTPRQQYGRWVYYPWSGRLVHTLAPAEFEELRLDRNRNRITSTEQRRLAALTVGIVGLSVGNAIALTLAQEGVCGHLRLADFDRLDLSNMNRLRARVDEVGLPKTVLAARQIYELNPYANLSVFDEGLTPATCEQFLSGPPSLDVVVDECDSLPMKFLVRERARARRLPVLMATSDRGRLDVERFDVEPGRPLFHGVVGSLTAAELGQVSRDERVAVVLRILGTDDLSTTFAASLVEVDRTLSTWPQLASDVALGGAAVTAAVRRLGLGQQLPSGRTYLDLESALDSTPTSVDTITLGQPTGDGKPPPDSQVRASAACSEVTTSNGPDFIRFVVEHAILAPSGGNCQPWRFHVDGERLFVGLNRSRSTTLLDRRKHASLLALGAAIENIAVAAAHRDYSTRVERFPSQDDPDIVAALHFVWGASPAERELARAFPYLGERVTNRRLAPPRPLPTGATAALVRAAESRGTDLQFLTDPVALLEAGRILGEGDRIRFVCQDLHREVFGELRFTREDVLCTRDGIDLATLELRASQAAALRLLARPDVAARLRVQEAGLALTELARDQVASASAVGLLRLRADEPADWLEGGRALQHVWLSATALGLAFQPMTALLYMFEVLDDAGEGTYTERECSILRELRQRLARLFAERTPAPWAMLFRLAVAPAPTARALRLPVDVVLQLGPR